MNNLISYIKQYPAYIIALVVVIILAGFVFKKAIAAYKKYYENYRTQEAEITRLTVLKEKYFNISKEELAASDDIDLLEGLALSYQLRLQKHEDMDKRFLAYPIQKQYIYTLDVFASSKSASEFFKENGRELTELIVPALCYISLDDQAKEIERLRIMFDEKDETTSINQAVIDEVDGYFKNENLPQIVKQASISVINRDAEMLVNED